MEDLTMDDDVSGEDECGFCGEPESQCSCLDTDD